MKKRLIPILILIAYSALLIKVLVFKDVPVIRIGPVMLKFGGTHEGAANLVPFKTIAGYLLDGKGFIVAALNIIGNIILLVPVGFIIPFIFKNMTWQKSLTTALAAGFAIEGTQALLHVGIFDIDDVILNGLGVMVGYWLFKICTKMIGTMKHKKTIITAVTVIAIITATTFYAINGYTKSLQRVTSAGSTAENGQPSPADSTKDVISPSGDPCGGTGGTGQIISVGNNTVTVKLNNGSSKLIKINKHTKIKNSAGLLPAAGLKTGDRVTLVIGLDPKDESMASAIFVCNAKAGNK